MDLVLEALSKNHSQIRKAGASDIFLTATLGYINQCNWELNNKQLKKLANLGLSLGISCYEDIDLLKEPIEYADPEGNRYKAYLDEEGCETHELVG